MDVIVSWLDVTLPGGFVAGSGPLDHGPTMAFATRLLGQAFNVTCAPAVGGSDVGLPRSGLSGPRWRYQARG